MRQKVGDGLLDGLVRRICGILRAADPGAMSQVKSDHASLCKLRHEHQRR